MNSYFTPSEINLLTSAARNAGITNIAAFIAFAESKQKEFGNVIGGYNPNQTIEACARKFIKQAGR